jgi:hypothetical protein
MYKIHLRCGRPLLAARLDGRGALHHHACQSLRIYFGTSVIGAANTIYGVLLVIFIISSRQGLSA